MMKKIRNSLNYNFEEQKYEQSNKPSMTIPDQSMSMRTILEKHAKGIPFDNVKPAIYEEEGESKLGINPKTLDLVDIQQISEKNIENIKELDKQHKEELAAKEKKRKEKEDEFNRKLAAIEEWEKKQKTPTTT